MTRSVLLIPAPGDPGGLLREGPCGARPPVLHRQRWAREPDHWSEWRTWKRSESPASDLHCDPENRDTIVTESALVLAWGGEPVPEGCDRAIRALGSVGSWRSTMREHYADEVVVGIARTCEAAGLGTAVIVEAP